jgi:excisionase family DNA binding protein
LSRRCELGIGEVGNSDIHSYSIREAARLTGFSPAQIRGAAKRGELAAMMPNGYMRGARIRESELLRWLRDMEARGRA